MRSRRPGELAIVLHTHMPYVEGFGTWPFGEEWLWEAIAGCYVPLLDVLGRAPITLSLTPVLCDQLESPDAMRRSTPGRGSPALSPRSSARQPNTPRPLTASRRSRTDCSARWETT